MTSPAFHREPRPLGFFVGAGPLSSANSSSPTARTPSGMQSGDVMVVQLGIIGTSTVTVVPAGWTLIDDTFYNTSTSHFLTYWAVYTGIQSFQWTISAGVAWSTTIWAFRGIDRSTPVDVWTTTPNIASSINVVAPSLTPTRRAIILDLWSTVGNRAHSTAAHRFRKTATSNVVDRIYGSYAPIPFPANVAVASHTQVMSAAASYGIQGIALNVA